MNYNTLKSTSQINKFENSNMNIDDEFQNEETCKKINKKQKKN